MKGNHIKKVLISAATIAACSILTALPVYADDTYSDDVWAYRAVANVVEAVNIRAAASEDSTIVGYLTTAASADVIERGETWFRRKAESLISEARTAFTIRSMPIRRRPS